MELAAKQSNLFGVDVRLPPAEAKESKLAERRRKAKQAYDATSAQWKAATYRFAVEEFLPHRERFMFEDLTNAYNAAAATRQLPATVNGKAMAGLQRILVSEGKIELIKGVTGIRSNGQDGKLYRSNLYEPGILL